jgi:Flp pilus assembly protein TadD
MQGKHDKALALFDELLELAPTHNEAAFARGNVLVSLSRRAEAIVASRRSIRLNQYHAESTHNLGVQLMANAGEQVSAIV